MDDKWFIFIVNIDTLQNVNLPKNPIIFGLWKKCLSKTSIFFLACTWIALFHALNAAKIHLVVKLHFVWVWREIWDCVDRVSLHPVNGPENLLQTLPTNQTQNQHK